jgi:hypothetical protein
MENYCVNNARAAEQTLSGESDESRAGQRRKLCSGLSLSLSGAGKIMARDAKLIRSRATCSADYKAPNRRAVTMQGCGTIAKAAGAANLQTAK